jgi:hypothetical protein
MRVIHKKFDIKRNEDGSTVTEFALVFPMLLLMIVGIVEVGYYFYLSNAIENAALSASRFGVTGGQISPDTDRATEVRNIVLAETFASVDPDKLTVDFRVFDTFTDIGREPEAFADENSNGIYDEGEAFSDENGNGIWDNFVGAVGLGDAGDIVLYRVTYEGASLSGFGDFFGAGYTIEAAVAVRNEPFPTNTGPGSGGAGT